MFPDQQPCMFSDPEVEQVVEAIKKIRIYL